MDPVVAVPVGAVIVVGALVFWRWLVRLQDTSDDHAERIAYLEAKVNGKRREG